MAPAAPRTTVRILARIAAATIAECDLGVSIPEGTQHPGLSHFLMSLEGKRLMGNAAVRRESDAALIAEISRVARIRYAAPDRVPAAVLAAAAETGFYVAREPVPMEGRLELLHYFQNQSVCNTYHRYGNLGERAIG